MKTIILLLLFVACGKDPGSGSSAGKIATNNFDPSLPTYEKVIEYPDCSPGSECQKECFVNTDIYCAQNCQGAGTSSGYNNCNLRCRETYPVNCPRMECEKKCKNPEFEFSDQEINKCIDACTGYN